MSLDLPRIAKAFVSNQVARFAPRVYVKLTRQTGRGDRESETPEAIARYFESCVDDYFEILGIPAASRAEFLRDKVILEYGPGDLPGVAMLLVAKGARKAYCVDRFSLVSIDKKSLAVINCLAAGLSGVERQRLLACLANSDTPKQVFSADHIEYLVRPNGLSGMDEAVDLVISRAVLEHVNDLEATFADMVRAMRPGSLSLHQVDLKSHGLHRTNSLDFLEYPQWLWSLMYSHKGVPNRYRVDRYRELLGKLPLEVLDFHATTLFNKDDVKNIYLRLAEPFRGISPEDLAWQGFWFFCRKKN